MYPRRRPLTLTVILLLALVAGAATLGGRSAPAAQAQTRPKLVYVYDNDLASRDSFKTMLELRGYDVTTVTTTTVTLGQVDWTNVQAVLIGDDTGNPANLYDWGGRTLPVPDNLYIIGIGQGGASFFEEDQDPNADIAGVPVIGNGNSWLASGKSAYVVDPGAAAWNNPTPLSVPPSGLVDLYARAVPFRAALSAAPAGGVIPIGRQSNDQTHYPLIAQQFSGQAGPWCGLLWGFRRPPSQMTSAGRNAFANLVKNQPCGANPVSPVDVAIAKAGPKSAIVGQPLTYTLTVANGRTAAPGVKVVDTLPAGVVFVSASSTQGTCSYAAGKVTCSIGAMAPGATVTITIVVKPTATGTLVNSASVSARARDTDPANNSAGVQTVVNNRPQFTPITALPYKPIFTGPIQALPNSDLSIFGIEVTQGIQCFDTSKGLAGCPNNWLPLVAKRDSTARIYMKYSGPGSSMNNVPVRLVLLDANNVQYVVNTSARALEAISQGSAADSANIYFNVNFSNNTFVRFYAIVDPNSTIAETNETNNRYPASGFMSINFSQREAMKIVGKRLRYHPAGYAGTQYAGGWAVNGGAADWYEQMLPIKNGGISYSVASGYLDWTTTLNSDGQHALIQSLNSRWLLENIFPWLFSGAYTGARHVYGWAPDAGYGGGHADMPVYPHAGGLGVVGIGTDEPGASTDNPGPGALIFGHELTHDYNIKHTDTADGCGSSDDTSDYPYGSASIQEFGFNPYTGKVYDPANSHDLMSYCPAGGSKQGWISPFTWQRMFDNLNPSMALQNWRTQAVPESVLAINLTVTNPALGPETGVLGDLFKVDAPSPPVIPAPGAYAVELRGAGNALLSTTTFSVTFTSEYAGHGGDEPSDEPGDPSVRPLASASMTIPWVDGTTEIVLRHNGNVLDSRTVSAGSPLVEITSPGAAVSWTAGTTQTLQWDAQDPDGDTLRYTVFYSHDGAEWALLATGLTVKSYSIPVDSLAGGAETRFRVVATDGVNTGDDETDFPIAVPDKAPVAIILNPVADAQALPGDLVVMQGSGSDFEDGTLPDVSLTWSSDRQGVLGTGTSLPINNLQLGAHMITLSVVDSQGHTSQTTVALFIGAKLHVPVILR
jgi:uncharacterized repeat protein (TIGR01451 family)